MLIMNNNDVRQLKNGANVLYYADELGDPVPAAVIVTPYRIKGGGFDYKIKYCHIQLMPGGSVSLNGPQLIVDCKKLQRPNMEKVQC
jgi:hypothetical protein